ncbi:hypothetical protein Bca52824_005158 [Brassica carinata]|uniref:Uncharacterized protein n=1 Tax=Brassica carinata TaxID=52824 RepID=A0A8X7WN98_BRACI|nr:hypothetical protein Bca52824_005158 [Brassica carinata]
MKYENVKNTKKLVLLLSKKKKKKTASSRRCWLLVATSSSTCISLLSFRSSFRVLCCSRSRYLSIGAPMVSSRPKVSSTPLFYGDSRSVNLCRSFTRRLTLYRPPHRGLRSVSSNRRSVYFILPLSMSLRLEDPHRRSPSISQTTTSDVLTVVSGIPHKTRFLDPKLFQFRVMGSPSLISLTTIFHHHGVPSSGATLSAVPVTRIPPNSTASHRASSASLFQQGHDSIFFKLGLQILNLGLTQLLLIINGPTSDEFNGVFTEADLHTTPYFSCAKSLLSNHLPVGSPGSPSPPLASVLVKKRTSPSISITDLLSCGAVRSGPEDAADFVSTILRGADWVLTSHFHVTISQLSNCVVKALSTHLSLVFNSLSSSHEELSILSAFDIVVYLFNQRGWYIPSCYCNQNN